MKKFFISVFIIANLGVSANATIGFLTGERTSGLNKICFYNVLGSTYTLNIKSIELCPLSYDF